LVVEKQPVFHLDAVTYSYPDGVAALSGVSMSIMDGESVAVLGANGCGKSTLLRLLDGLIFPTEGVVSGFGRALTPKELSNGEFALQFRRRVGLLFQDSDVQLFSPTVEDEIAFGPLHLGFPQQEVAERVEQALQRMGLAPLRHRPPYRLSGGEKRKVALASVLVVDPEALLLDEPTTGLDARSQGEVIDLIGKLVDEGKTVITSTHDLSIVSDIASKVYVLGEDHRLLAEGAPDEVLLNHELLFKANLVHVHGHRHGQAVHRHPHIHGHFHEEDGA
jgi:cobalt/nickel transport system ATP-binding protein